MNREIDYESEVRKVYPDAMAQWMVTEGQLCGWLIKDSRSMFSKTISDGLHNQSQAWQSAYDQHFKSLNSKTDDSK